MELLLLHSGAAKEHIGPITEMLNDLHLPYAECLIEKNTQIKTTVLSGGTELPSHIIVISAPDEEPAWWVYYALGYVHGTGTPGNLCMFRLSGDSGKAESGHVPEDVAAVSTLSELKLYLLNESANYSLIGRREDARKKLVDEGLALSAASFGSCVKTGQKEYVLLYLDAGFSPDTKTEKGVPMLNWAIRNEQYEIFSLLLAAGADCNEPSGDNGNSPLMEAVFIRDEKIINQLLKRNCNVNIQNKNGQTALIVSVANGYTEIAEDLIRKNADIGLTDNLGMTARKYAELFHHTQIMTLLDPGIAS